MCAVLAVPFCVVYSGSAKCIFSVCERILYCVVCFRASLRVNACACMIYMLMFFECFLCAASGLYPVVFEVFIFV